MYALVSLLMYSALEWTQHIIICTRMFPNKNATIQCSQHRNEGLHAGPSVYKVLQKEVKVAEEWLFVPLAMAVPGLTVRHYRHPMSLPLTHASGEIQTHTRANRQRVSRMSRQASRAADLHNAVTSPSSMSIRTHGAVTPPPPPPLTSLPPPFPSPLPPPLLTLPSLPPPSLPLLMPPSLPPSPLSSSV